MKRSQWVEIVGSRRILRDELERKLVKVGMTLPAEICELIEGLRLEVANLRRENEALRAENARLRAENAELRRRLDQDSSTSSKPPSSDGLRKSRAFPAAFAAGRARRAAGSPGTRAIRCGGWRRPTGLSGTKRRRAAIARGRSQLRCRSAEARQVFDLPERLIEVTEHQVAIYAGPIAVARRGRRSRPR